MSNDGITGVRPLSVNKTRAAALLGVSVDFFDEHIAGELKSVRRGRLWLFPVAELEGWLDRNATGLGTA
jgi:excisionase family DNA binding protein